MEQYLKKEADNESENKLPENAKKYIKYVEEKSGVRISLISVGSKRKLTINLFHH